MYRNYIIIEMVKHKANETGINDQRKGEKDQKPKSA